MAAWRAAGQPVVVDAAHVATILDEHHVIADMRPAEASAQGHIPGAVALPAARIRELGAGVAARGAEARPAIPGLRDRLAPIVLYGEDGQAAAEAYRTVAGWGYSNVALLDGGYAAWIKGGFSTEAGPARTAAAFTRQPLKGEVSAEEFTRLATSGKAVVLDVREDEEVARGMIPGALHIPLGRLNERLDTLPRSAEYVIHCAVGTRARMAYVRMKVRGFEHVRFLNAPILVRPDGTFCIDCVP